MATLQLRNQSYRILFRFQGKRYTFTLGKVSEREAENSIAQTDLVLMRLEQGLLQLPEQTDIVAFVKNGGKIPPGKKSTPIRELTLGQLRDAYIDAQKVGAIEKESLASAMIHLKHCIKTIGVSFSLSQLTQDDLQRHINLRASAKYRGKPLSPVTIKKEIDSFRAVWSWGVHAGKVQGTFPSKGRIYPKTDEKLPFMTWEEIERRIERNSLDKEAQKELWECLYLRKEQIDDFLEDVRTNTTQPWVYPLVCTATTQEPGEVNSCVLR